MGKEKKREQKWNGEGIYKEKEEEEKEVDEEDKSRTE
jgi:hypothetical protein